MTKFTFKILRLWKQKRFIFYNRDYSTLEVVELEFFTEDNGITDEDIQEISSLEIAKFIMLGMDETTVTRI